MFTLKRMGFTLVLVLVVCFVLSGLASAHGQTTVGDYELEIGFHNEPVYVGQPNGLDLFVTNAKTNEKVNGLEKTLKAEIIHGSSRRTLEITPQDGVDGGYTSAIVPTATGDYTWHIFGTIENTPVDVSMTSSPTTFDSADTMAAEEFPSVQPSAADVQAQAAAAAQTARIALIVGVIGVLLGAGGLVFGLTGRRTATRAPQSAATMSRI
jgi:hypothetical protein